MKHTIERSNPDLYILDDSIHIKWVEQLGNDNGWCIFDKETFYQKTFRTFENALSQAMGKSIRKKEVLTPPVGV